MGEPLNDYEIAKSILSLLEYGIPASLKQLSNDSGISYQTLMFAMRYAIHSGIITSSRDGREIFYTLRKLEYERDLAIAYSQPVPPEGRYTKSSVVTRTRSNTATASSLSGENESIPRSEGEARKRTIASVRESNTHLERVPKVANAEPEKRERKSSMELPFIDRKRSQQMTANAIPSRNIPLSGAFKRAPSPSSSGIHKSVYINNISNNRPASSPSRSMFTAMPPQQAFAELHRTDTNFPMKNVSELQPRTAPLLAFRAGTNNVEYSDAMMRELIGVAEGVPLYALDIDKTCFELWSTFSALANSGGGIIMVGVRKHGISYVIRKNPHIDDLLKTVQKEFNDRTVISDAPHEKEKDISFIQTRADGKKQFIIIFVDPEAFDRLPVFTKLDSFGALKDGCYCIKNNEVVRCSDDETKELWQRFYLCDQQPDWDQSGEMLHVEMNRKLKLAKLHAEDEDDDDVPYLTNRIIAKNEKKAGKLPKFDTEYIEISDENGDICETICIENPEKKEKAHSERRARRLRENQENTEMQGQTEGAEAQNAEENAQQPEIEQPRRPAAFNAFAQEAPRMEIIEPARLVAEKRAAAAAAQTEQTTNIDLHDAIQQAKKGEVLETEASAADRTVDRPSQYGLPKVGAQSPDAIRAAILLAGDFKPNIKQSALNAIHSRFPEAQSQLLDIQPSPKAIREARATKSAEAKDALLAQNEAIKAQILREEAERAQKLAQEKAEREANQVNETLDITNQPDPASAHKRGRKPGRKPQNADGSRLVQSCETTAIDGAAPIQTSLFPASTTDQPEEIVFKAPLKRTRTTKADASDEAAPKKATRSKKAADASSDEKPKAKRASKAAAELEIPVELDASVPPLFTDANQEEIAKLAEPAIEFPRLPAVRLASIAVRILRLSRLTVQELADIMHRTPVSVRKNIIASLADDPNFKSVGKHYYYTET